MRLGPPPKGASLGKELKTAAWEGCAAPLWSCTQHHVSIQEKAGKLGKAQKGSWGVTEGWEDKLFMERNSQDTICVGQKNR